MSDHQHTPSCGNVRINGRCINEWFLRAHKTESKERDRKRQTLARWKAEEERDRAVVNLSRAERKVANLEPEVLDLRAQCAEQAEELATMRRQRVDAHQSWDRERDHIQAELAEAKREVDLTYARSRRYSDAIGDVLADCREYRHTGEPARCDREEITRLKTELDARLRALIMACFSLVCASPPPDADQVQPAVIEEADFYLMEADSTTRVPHSVFCDCEKFMHKPIGGAS